MFTTSQAKSQNRKRGSRTRRMKKAMIDEGITVTELAREIGCSRTAASQAINKLKFPALLKKIEDRLNG